MESAVPEIRAAESEPRAVGAMSDEPIASYRATLLDLAFDAATAIPVKPHIKSRSLAQEAVVTACLELDQPQRALRYIEKIDDWRRGAGYADLAFYAAQHQATDEVPRYLKLAIHVADTAEGEDGQGWRRDRIRTKIAKTHYWLGQNQEAARFTAGVEASEVGKAEAVRSMLGDTAVFDEQIRAVAGVVAAGDFDQVRNALESCVQLFNRFYDDPDRRSRAQATIQQSWSKLPGMVRIELMSELTDFALAHDDHAKALELVAVTQGVIDESRWTAEDRIRLMARLAGRQFLAGDTEQGLHAAEAALELFEHEQVHILDIYRAGVLRPIAEAYASMGDKTAALAVYKRAVEEGVKNPNSKPRAEDLSATSCSMARNEVEPDAALNARMAQIRSALGDPW